jgi:hypothetical protein
MQKRKEARQDLRQKRVLLVDPARRKRNRLSPEPIGLQMMWLRSLVIWNPGLPDVIFFKPKTSIWVNFEGLWDGKSWYVFGLLENFTAIWYILWPMGNLVVIWNIFPRFGIL